MSNRPADLPAASLAARAQGADRLIGPAILLAAALLVAGWLLPIMTVERLLFLTQRVSIVEGALVLWDSGNYFLFAVITLFSILFPTVKLIAAGYLWYGKGLTEPGHRRWLARLEAFGRWSMLDVFVVALAVVAVQISLIDRVAIHAGIYAFTAGVLLSMIAVRRIVVLARRALERVPGDMGDNSTEK
jgi:paraquat-inducible protein A